MEKEFDLQIKNQLQKILKEKFNNSQSSLAEAINTSQANISRWITGKFIPNLYTIKKICDVINIPIEAFFLLPSSQNNNDMDECIKIPYYEKNIRNGNNIVLYEKYYDFLKLNAKFFKKESNIDIKNIFAIKAYGHSMEPIIYDKDTILFIKNYNHKQISEALYVIQYNETILIKLLQYKAHNIVKVISTNTKYDSFEIDIEKDVKFKLIGKVLFSIKRLY